MYIVGCFYQELSLYNYLVISFTGGEIMDLANLFSIIFFMGCVYCLFLGMYIINIKHNSPLNQQFFLIAAATCIWLFCFSIANNAPDLKTVILWRRFSVFGWGVIYSIIIHYSILLSKKTNKSFKLWQYFIMYFPALVVVYIFSISPMAPERYDFVRTPLRWINISPSDIIWDWFFNLYYVIYILMSFYLIYNWGRKSNKANEKKQSWIIIISFSIAAVLGTITDIVISKYSGVRVPQLAPLMGIIPLTAIFYCIKRYGLMKPKKTREVKPGMILSEYALSKYYNVVAYTYVFTSLLHFFINYYIIKVLLTDILPLGFFLFFTGVIVWLMPIFIKRNITRDIVFTGII